MDVRVKQLFWSCNLGTGRYPSKDPFGQDFSADYMPERWKLSGQFIAGGYFAVLDGIQSDQEFLKRIFNLKRPWAIDGASFP